MASSKNVLQFVREDDFVEYFFYPASNINTTQDPSTTESILKSYLNQIEPIITKYSATYIWHKDPFKLSIQTFNTNILNENAIDEDFLPHLHGITHFGENIDDEWFIVYLITQITLEIQDLCARVVDSDGEFLMIEAANVLPKWANPDLCDKGVYIYQGHVHLIENDSDSNMIVIPEAVQQIFDGKVHTIASPQVQEVITRRIIEFEPAKISSKYHRTNAYLPIGVATILKAEPTLIAPAVLAFCARDHLDLKVCRAMKYFPPENRVMTSILLTKYLYAMLVQSLYTPDRRTGWNIQAPNSPDHKAHLLGVKIACGFEILISQAKLNSNEELENDKKWIQFHSSLKDRGYFRDLLEHSNEYNILLEQAKVYYRELKDSEHYTPNIAQKVLELSHNLECNVDEFKCLELPPEDDDGWLNLEPSALDDMLEARYGIPKRNENDSGIDISKRLTEFINQKSDLDGVEFPSDDGPPIRPKRRPKPDENPTNKVNFDPNEFTCAMQNILDLVIPDDKWESESEMSDYENDSDNAAKLDDKMASEGGKNMIKKYMDAMDQELAGTTIGASFEKKTSEETEDSYDDIEHFQPIDIDRNALKNFVKSYQAQYGGPGPAENLLAPLGIRLDSEFDELKLD